MSAVLEQKTFFFIGVAGSGMSALAHYLAQNGKVVKGSDRYFGTYQETEVRQQLEKVDIECFPQDGSGLDINTDVVVYSTAVEENNIEYQRARELGVTMITRPDLLALIANDKSKRTIAVGGTAGKSTTTAMIFHILHESGLCPSMINGAGLTDLQKQGYVGNAWVGTSDLMVIEADESNGTIVNYTPDISLVLNAGRDHKEDDELLSLFRTFCNNTQSIVIVNRDDALVGGLSTNSGYDFSAVENGAEYVAQNYCAEGFSIQFDINDVSFSLRQAGEHNMMNALAAVSACAAVGVSLEQSADALQSFGGTYRRLSFVGEKNGVTVVDDFAHNPNEVVTAIKACQKMGKRVFAWFQPHGFGPLRFMHKELSEMVSDILRDEDVYLSSDVFYAGGTVSMDINSNIVTDAIATTGKKAVFIANKSELPQYFAENTVEGDVIVLMGARDPLLAQFAQDVFNALPLGESKRVSA